MLPPVRKIPRTLCRLVEDADLQAAKDLFGADLDLDKLQPKNAKDFEDLARALAAKYLHPHGRRCGLHVQEGGRCSWRMLGWLLIDGMQMLLGTCLVASQKEPCKCHHQGMANGMIQLGTVR